MTLTKFSPQVPVWGAVFSRFSDLHIVPQGQTMNQEYYCQHILEGNLLKRIKKTTELSGSVSACQLVPAMSDDFSARWGSPPYSCQDSDFAKIKISHFWNM
jgi:hypothetical protein